MKYKTRGGAYDMVYRKTYCNEDGHYWYNCLIVQDNVCYVMLCCEYYDELIGTVYECSMPSNLHAFEVPKTPKGKPFVVRAANHVINRMIGKVL